MIVRGLDPPLHEFLPDVESLLVKQAKEGLTDEEEKLFEAAKAWREANPMIGVRGVRLGVLKPGLYAMQVRALMEAAYERAAAGGHPIVEIMIPLTDLARGDGARPLLGRAGARTTAPEGEARPGRRDAEIEVAIGTMIETPRAALLADEIAEEADFFSFGTNDLTQMTFGFSRDDVEGRMMAAYLSQGLLNAQPVRERRHRRCRRAGSHSGRARAGGATGPQDRRLRRARRRPGLDRLLRKGGLDYVELLAFRVPIARLAAAQAVLAIDAEKGKRPPPSSLRTARGRPDRGRRAPTGRPRYRPGDGDSRRGRGRGPCRHGHPRAHRRVHAP